MNIDTLMTSAAPRVRFAVRPAGFVAGLAGQRAVRSIEMKIGGVMVERRRGQLDDVGVPAEMFAMASLALATRDVRQAAMEAALAGDVGGDVLVTDEAQRGLTRAVATVVATRTALFEFGVRLADFSRHEQFLEAGRARRARARRCQGHECRDRHDF